MWFPLALFSACIGAIFVIITKKILKSDIRPFTLTWGVLLVATPIITVKMLNEPFPEVSNTFFIAIAGSVLFYSFMKLFGLRAIQMGSLSKVYPLSTLAPILILIIAWFPPLNEHPPALSLLGAVIAIVGIYVLSITNASKGIFHPFVAIIKEKPLRFALAAVLMEAVVVTFDKLAIRSTTPLSTTFTMLSENIIAILALIPVLLKYEPTFLRDLWREKWMILLLGAVGAVSGIAGMAAVGNGNIGIVSVVMKLHIFLVLILSFIFFKDKPKTYTVLGSILMFIGIVVIGLTSD